MQLKGKRDKARLIVKIVTWMVVCLKKIEYFFNIVEKWINKHEILVKLFLPNLLSYLLEFVIIRFVLVIILILGIVNIFKHKIIETILKHLK
ncbi:hypothetical protein CWE04_11910 [Thomasclavelia cocleata]|uniref:Uncharacterized protein n=1 Tax=Thomasclavelia cocleata TaxID=69824 RepID=A0A1I0BLC0_9FIRM|nr:hypothetical protein CWE04_11910 [Thomasclavelia cocleata]SET07736.1 hypothetical protein SAMN04489758_101173 [Thomasclavelia cocleata]